MILKTNRDSFLKIISSNAFFLFLVLLSPLFGQKVYAENGDYKLRIHLFYSYTCPHCASEKAFLDRISPKYPNLVIQTYEITQNRENLKLFMQVGQALGDKSGRVPFLVVGNEYIVGFLDEETHGVQIESAIKKAFLERPIDLVENIKNEDQEKISDTKTDTSQNHGISVTLPVIGKLNNGSLSLPLMTIVLGLADGFNPCAMWALLFLISILLGMEKRFKMWLLGGVFIFASGFVYFLFMAAWLNLFLFIGYAVAIRVLIGITAASLGGYYVWKYFIDKKTGCLVEGSEKKQETFNKIRKYTENKNILIALAGMIILAFAVNLVELLCSAGIPAIYTKALTMSNLPKIAYYLYLALYIFFYMLDDMIVFVIAMITLEAVGIKQSYAKYSHLLGGFIMLAIGILMLFKPEVLMFG